MARLTSRSGPLLALIVSLGLAAGLLVAPAQVDRADFPEPSAPWLVAGFSSATCETCASVWERAELLGSAEVAVVNVELTAQKALHERYHIDAVPLTVVADSDGVVCET